MWISITCAFLAGVFGANGVPHFVRGITRETYPCLFGNSSIPNVIAGWLSLIVAIALACATDWSQNPILTFIAAAFGALVMALFHASGLAIGRASDRLR